MSRRFHIFFALLLVLSLVSCVPTVSDAEESYVATEQGLTLHLGDTSLWAGFVVDSNGNISTNFDTRTRGNR